MEHSERYWIHPGVGVILRDHVTDLNMDRLVFHKMTVDRVARKSKDLGTERKPFVDGVKCHWLDMEMQYHVGQFHTKELVPYAIAEKGIAAVNEWIHRVLIKD